MNHVTTRYRAIADLWFAAGSWFTMVTCLPLLVAQGRWVRRRTPRLPETVGRDVHDIVTLSPAHDTPLLSCLILGESTVAGVGVEQEDESLGFQIARAMHEKCRRPLRFQALGRNGASIRYAERNLVPEIALASADVVILAFGVNDILEGRSGRSWVTDLESIIRAVRSKVGHVPVIVAAVPPMGTFPAIPPPLRTLLGLRATLFDRLALQFTRRAHDVIYCSFPVKPSVDMFCSDRIHPSVDGYRLWGSMLAARALAALGI